MLDHYYALLYSEQYAIDMAQVYKKLKKGGHCILSQPELIVGAYQSQW